MKEIKVVICPKCRRMQVVQQNIPKNAFKCRLCGKSTKEVKILYKTENAADARLFMSEAIFKTR